MAGEFEAVYQVVARDDDFLVVDNTDRTIMQCRDIHSAQHYATLMNSAYRAGYKIGFRAGKESTQS